MPETTTTVASKWPNDDERGARRVSGHRFIFFFFFLIQFLGFNDLNLWITVPRNEKKSPNDGINRRLGVGILFLLCFLFCQPTFYLFFRFNNKLLPPRRHAHATSGRWHQLPTDPWCWCLGAKKRAVEGDEEGDSRHTSASRTPVFFRRHLAAWPPLQGLFYFNLLFIYSTIILTHVTPGPHVIKYCEVSIAAAATQICMHLCMIIKTKFQVLESETVENWVCNE